MAGPEARAAAPLVALEAITVRYPGAARPALDGVTLTLRAGEWVSVLGANGSGKTTLARVLAGLLVPDGGEIRLFGERIAADQASTGLRRLRRAVGMVFQNPEAQIVAATVEDDVAFGPENLGLAAREIEARTDAAIVRMGLDGHRHDEPARLSGGEKQRLAIAGVLAMEPRAVVFDEASSMLDPRARRRLMGEMRREHAAGRAIVHITHDMEEARDVPRIVVLDRGRLLYDGTPAPFFEALAAGRISPPGLLPPFWVRLVAALRAEGFPVEPERWEAEAVVEAVWRSFSNA
ncbi:MAG: ATP-binding cassette domain-containing protein [Hydrogenibacillus sp.]|nr:ATP-binding cassette domain-containing protein [Hydrogenibacillus sp.]